jgi:mRNA-degrading endonuclease HigB of HigAB toxin-antitoxin module
MRIITSRSVTLCWKTCPNAKNSIAIWEEKIKIAKCKSHEELKTIFPDADYVPNNNFKHLTVFNIKHNKYRLAVDIFFNTGHIYI